MAEKDQEQPSTPEGEASKPASVGPWASPVERAADSAAADERPAAPEAPSARGPSSGFIWMIVALLVVVAIGAGAATTPVWLPRLKAALPGGEPDPFDAKSAAALAARVQALEEALKARGASTDPTELERERARLREQVGTVVTRIESLEQSVGAVKRMAVATSGAKEAAKAQSSLDELQKRLDDLEKDGTALKDVAQRLQSLEKTETGRSDAARDGNRALNDAIEDLTRRLGAIEKSEVRAARAVDDSRALVLAVAQLREATRGAAPFVREFDVVRALVSNDPQTTKLISDLTPLAPAGAPTLIALRSSFDATAEAVTQAASRGEGWVERTVERISSLVTIRRTDGRAEVGSIDAVLATAEQALKEGDLIAAVDSLSALSGQAAVAARPWLEQARARVTVERALAALHVQAISRLTPPAKG